MASRPFGTKRAPLVDAFCKNLFVSDKTAEQRARELLLSAPEFLDRMLLCLFDALWLKQSEEWSNRGVANMPSDEPYETADMKWRARLPPRPDGVVVGVRLLGLCVCVLIPLVCQKDRKVVPEGPERGEEAFVRRDLRTVWLPAVWHHRQP